MSMNKITHEEVGEALQLTRAKLKKLVEIGILLGREHDRNKLLRYILMGAQELTYCAAATIYLKTKHDHLFFAIRTSDDNLPSREIPMFDPQTGEANDHYVSVCDPDHRRRHRHQEPLHRWPLRTRARTGHHAGRGGLQGAERPAGRFPLQHRRSGASSGSGPGCTTAARSPRRNTWWTRPPSWKPSSTASTKSAPASRCCCATPRWPCCRLERGPRPELVPGLRDAKASCIDDLCLCGRMQPGRRVHGARQGGAPQADCAPDLGAPFRRPHGPVRTKTQALAVTEPDRCRSRSLLADKPTTCSHARPNQGTIRNTASSVKVPESPVQPRRGLQPVIAAAR
jgi:hypothetical protein